MSIEAKILIRVLSDRSEAYSVALDDTETEDRVEIDCTGEMGAKYLIASIMVVSSDVEIKPTESINDFARLHAESSGNGKKPDPA